MGLHDLLRLLPLLPPAQDQEEDSTVRREGGDVVNGIMSDKDVLEKLIIVTPSRKAPGGGRTAGLDTGSSRLIADGLAMYEQELAEVGGLGDCAGGRGLGGLRRPV
jgi:hypothetical protein